jgi:hypothetical protein
MIEDTGLTIDTVNYFFQMILAAALGLFECWAEQIHNTFDNGGTKVNITMYDGDYVKIELDQLERSTVKVMVYGDDCPKSLNEPARIMASLQKKEDKHKTRGAGNFNFGEIGSIFNMAEYCIYLTPTEIFTIRVCENTHAPMLFGTLNMEQQQLVESLGISNPEKGTLKVFLMKDKGIISKDRIKSDISDQTNMEVSYDGTVVTGYNYHKENEIVNCDYNKDITIFGIWNGNTIDWFKPVNCCEGGQVEETEYISLKNNKNWSDKKSTSAVEGELECHKGSDFDIKMTTYMSIYPSHGGKNPNPPGLRFNHVMDGKSVTLYNQEKTSTFANWTITGKPKQDHWNIHSPGKDTEYVIEFELLKIENKGNVYKTMGYFAIKSRGASFYESPQRVIYRYVMVKLMEQLHAKFRANTGRKGAWPTNLHTDKDGNWYETKKGDNGKKVICISTDQVNPEPVDPEPLDPEPLDPEPVNPEPVDPEPVNPEPVNPEPVNPEPLDPEPVNPEPVDPEPLDPEPVNPEPVNPEPNIYVNGYNRGNVSGSDADELLVNFKEKYTKQGSIPAEVVNAINKWCV